MDIHPYLSHEWYKVDEIMVHKCKLRHIPRKHDKHKSKINIRKSKCKSKYKFLSNVLVAISKLKFKNSKNHFSILVFYLPADVYTGI